MARTKFSIAKAVYAGKLLDEFHKFMNMYHTQEPYLFMSSETAEALVGRRVHEPVYETYKVFIHNGLGFGEVEIRA